MKYKPRLMIRRMKAADFDPPEAMAFFDICLNLQLKNLNWVTLIELRREIYRYKQGVILSLARTSHNFYFFSPMFLAFHY
jgi:hypothetical protein